MQRDLPRVLLALPEEARRDLALVALREVAEITVFDCATGTTTAAFESSSPIDVAILSASLLGVEDAPLLTEPRFGFPELVFVVDDFWSPQRFALASRGFQYIVSRDELSDWLVASIEQLRQLARARRLTFAAYTNRPAAPGFPRLLGCHRRMKLHAAETSFRETILRTLLMEHGSRAKAAEEAGVPYRSFCEMLRKMGI
jgi:hypothetical protein